MIQYYSTSLQYFIQATGKVLKTFNNVRDHLDAQSLIEGSLVLSGIRLSRALNFAHKGFGGL